MESGSWAVVEVSLLAPGSSLECDLLRGSQVLLCKGSIITSDFIDSLKRQNIEFIKVTGAVAEQLKREKLRIAMSGGSLTASNAEPVQGDYGYTHETYYAGTIAEKEREIYKIAGIETTIDSLMLERVIGSVRTAYRDVASHGGFDSEALRAPVREMVREAISRPDSALKLLDVKRYEDYTVHHAVNVGLLFISLARNHIPKDMIMEMSLAAVMHDIGKARIPRELIEKRGALTEKEFEIVKTHTIIGFKILTQKCGFDIESAEIALSHHERWNGSGYPRGIIKFPLPIQIASLCDVYDALTTTRSYRTKIDFYSALNIIVKESGSGFSQFAVRLLIERVGLFPIGSFVMLSTNDVAVVSQVHPEQLYKPTVKVVYEPSNTVVDPPRTINLADTTQVTIARPLTLDEVMRMGI
jgi:putative nucleotidyltransferase with HDIG domain